MKKKRWLWIIGVVLLVLVIIYFMFGNKKKETVKQGTEPQIEYYTIEGVDQVFINGVVTPVRSQEFVKDTTLGKLGDLQVENGALVEEGTVLYQYIDPNSDIEISRMKAEIQNIQSERYKAARQMDLELKQLANGKSEEGALENNQLNRETIELKYDINGIDNRINQAQQQLDDILEKQVNKVTAPFKGKISIPQDKNRDSAILSLISEDFYVVGNVNEKDLSKIKVDQVAEIKTVSNNQQLKGKLTYISEIPNTASTEGGQGGSSNLSNYTVKLSLDSAEGIKNGYHVQSAINLSDKKIKIPSKAVQFEGDEAFVLVDDFGTVLKKKIVLTTGKDELGQEVEVVSGLESLDKVIVNSDKKLKDGDIIQSDNQPERPGEGAE